MQPIISQFKSEYIAWLPLQQQQQQQEPDIEKEREALGCEIVDMY